MSHLRKALLLPTTFPSVRRVNGALRRVRSIALSRSILAVGDQAIVSAVNFLTALLIGRACGQEELGLYSLGFSLTLLVHNVNMGLVFTPYATFNHRLSKRRCELYAGSSLAMAAGIGLVSAAVILCFGVVEYFSSSNALFGRMLIVLSVVVLPITMRGFLRGYTYAHLQLPAAVKISAVVFLVQLAGVTVLALTDSLTASTSFAAIGSGCGIVVAIWLARNRRKFAFRFKYFVVDSKRNLAFGSWVLGTRLASVLSTYSLHWILAIGIGMSSTGRFAAAMWIVGLTNPFTMTIGNLLTPRAARALTMGGVDSLIVVVRRVAIKVGGVLGAFATVMMIFGNNIVEFAFGDRFEGLGLLAGLLAVAALLNGLASVAQGGLLALGRSDRSFATRIVGLVITIVLAALLAPIYGSNGAGFGLVVGQASAAVATYCAYWTVCRDMRSVNSRSAFSPDKVDA